jgi:hypothetical protein
MGIDSQSGDEDRRTREDWRAAMEASRLALSLAKVLEHRLVKGIRIDAKRCEEILARGRELGYDDGVSIALESRTRRLAGHLARELAAAGARVESRVGSKVQAMRLQKKLTQYLVVRRMGGTNVTYLSQVENGRIDPSREWLLRCAKALECDPAELDNER